MTMKARIEITGLAIAQADLELMTRVGKKAAYAVQNVPDFTLRSIRLTNQDAWVLDLDGPDEVVASLAELLREVANAESTGA